MPGTPTTRLSLVQPVGADEPKELRLAATANAVTLDDAAIYKEGTFASRGAANSRPNGTIYRSTDSGSLAWTNGTSWLELIQGGGGVGQLTATVKSANYAAVAGDLVIAGSGGGPITITLPTPVANALVCVVADTLVTSTNTVTVAQHSTEKLFGPGFSNVNSVVLGAVGASITFQCDGTNWWRTAGDQDTGWVTITLATNWNAQAGFYVPAARVLGTTVMLRGSAVNNTGGSSNNFATLASAFRPAATVVVTPFYVAGAGLQIAATGATILLPSVANGSAMWLDGCTYSLS